MRNLKKVLSLALALVMLLGMMVVGAGAATSFQDADKIQNKEAVAVLVGMGIMKGRTNGSSDDVLFAPDGTLTRAEAAMMIAQMDLGVDAAAALKGNGSNTFSDVWAGYWAEGAIDYCVEQGYIKGDGAGHFLPGNPVSSVEFGSMALRLLGYDANNEGLVGDQWAVKAASLIRKAGLATSVAANTQPMTRDEMAQMAFNTLTAETVEYTGFNFSGDNISFSSPATVRRHSANNSGGQVNYTYDKKPIQSNITPIRFCEERFPTLKLDRSGENEFKEAYSVWTYRGVEITDSKIALNCISTTQKEKENDNSWMTNVKKLASGFEAYLNGKKITASVADVSYITNTLTKNGRLVEVYVNPDDLSEVEKVVAIDTALGEVTKVNSTDEKITIKLVESDVTNSTPSLVTDKGYGEFKVGDLVLVQGTNNGDANAKFFKTTSDGTKVISVTAPQKVEGFATTRHNNTDGTGKSIVMSGETYLAAYGQEKDTVKNFELSTSEDSTLYLDLYGYIMKAVGAKGYTAPADKLIAVSDVYQTLESGKLATKVEGMLSDGTTVKWTWKGTEPDEGNIYTYVKDSDGKYTLTRVKTNISTTTNSYVADVDKAFVFKASDSRGQGNGSNLFYSDDVLFIFVEPDGTITKATGVQSYDNNGEKIPVVAQALRLEQGTDDHIEIRAVFIQAEPDVVDVNDIIYVHEANANKNQVVEQKDGTNKVRYGYEAYNANAELIEEFLGDAKNQSTYFIKKELNEDGSYVMNETNKFVFNQKYVASANGTSGNAFTLVVEKDNEWVDLVRSSNTKVLDVSDDGLDIENISELNKAVNEGRLVTVSVIWTRTYSDGTYDAKAVFVTDVGAIGSYNSTVIGSDPRGGGSQPTEGAHKVESITEGAKALKFAVVDSHSGTAVPTDVTWEDTVSAVKDKVILVKAANGDKITTLNDADIKNKDTYKSATVTTAEIGSTGVFKFTMGEENLLFTDVTVNTPVIGYMSIEPDYTKINAKLTSGPNLGGFANNSTKTANRQIAELVVDYINGHEELGLTATVDEKLGALEDANGIILQKGTAKTTLAMNDIKVGKDLITVSIVNGTETKHVVSPLASAGDGAYLDDFLRLGGVTIENAGASIFVKTNDGTNDEELASNATSGNIADGTVIDTNSLKGYVKLTANAGAVTVTQTGAATALASAGTVQVKSIAAKNSADTFTGHTSSGVFVKVGADIAVTIAAQAGKTGTKVADTHNVSAQVTGVTGATTFASPYKNATPVAALAAGSAFDASSEVELTFSVSAVSAAVSAVAIALTETAVG